MSRAPPDNNILEISESKTTSGPHVEARMIENDSGTPKHDGEDNASHSLTNLPTIHTSNGDRRDETPKTPLTTQALHTHDIQQRHVPQPQHSVARETIEVPDRESYLLYGYGTRDYNIFFQARFCTGRQKDCGKTGSNEGNGGASVQKTIQKASSNLGSYFGAEFDTMNTPGETMDDASLAYWDTGTAYEPTAWGSDLAGIGGHLAVYTDQEYTGHGEFITD